MKPPKGQNMRYVGTEGFAGRILGCAVRHGDGTYAVMRFAVRYAGPDVSIAEEREGLTEAEARRFLRSDGRPGELRRA